MLIYIVDAKKSKEGNKEKKEREKTQKNGKILHTPHERREKTSLEIDSGVCKRRLVVLVGHVSNDLKASSVPIVYSMIKATNDDHQAQNKLKRALYRVAA